MSMTLIKLKKGNTAKHEQHPFHIVDQTPLPLFMAKAIVFLTNACSVFITSRLPNLQWLLRTVTITVTETAKQVTQAAQSSGVAGVPSHDGMRNAIVATVAVAMTVVAWRKVIVPSSNWIVNKFWPKQNAEVASNVNQNNVVNYGIGPHNNEAAAQASINASKQVEGQVQVPIVNNVEGSKSSFWNEYFLQRKIEQLKNPNNSILGDEAFDLIFRAYQSDSDDEDSDSED